MLTKILSNFTKWRKTNIVISSWLQERSSCEEVVVNPETGFYTSQLKHRQDNLNAYHGLWEYLDDALPKRSQNIYLEQMMLRGGQV